MFRARYHHSKKRESDWHTFYGSMLEAAKELFIHLKVSELDYKRPLVTTLLKVSPLALCRKTQES